MAIYAVVRVAHNSFYSYFGVTPEEVGLDQTGILARAALSFSIVVAGVVALVGLTVIVVNILGGALDRAVSRMAQLGMEPIASTDDRDQQNAQYAARLLRGLLVAVALVPVVLVAVVREGQVVTLVTDERHRENLRWAMLLLTLALMSLAYFIHRLSIREDESFFSAPWVLLYGVIVAPFVAALRYPSVVASNLQPWSRYLVATLLWLLIVSAVSIWTAQQAPSDRKRLKGLGPLSVSEQIAMVAILGALFVPLFMLAEARGDQIASAAFYGDTVRPSRFGLMSIRAEPYCVLSPSQTIIDGRPLVLLGDHNGYLILWDALSVPFATGLIEPKNATVDADNADDVRLLRIPSGDVVLANVRLSSREELAVSGIQICFALDKAFKAPVGGDAQ